jgi:hypothetical protein
MSAAADAKLSNEKALFQARAKAASTSVESLAGARLGREISSDVRLFFLEHRVGLAKAFTDFDTDGDSTLSVEEAMAALEPITRGHISRDDLRKAFMSFDTDSSGFLDFAEFRLAFHIPDTSSLASQRVAQLQVDRTVFIGVLFSRWRAQ